MGLTMALLSFFLLAGCTSSQNSEADTKKNQVSLNVQELKQDMASFDKIYIPALRFTSLGKLAESKKTMSLLIDNWNQFKAKYYNANPEDKQWTVDLDKIDKMIANADNVVKSETNLSEAHEKYLEHVRIVFMQLRQRNKIDDYFIDYLTEFHQPMEDIVLAAKGKTIQTLSDEDVSKIKNTLPVAIEKFSEIKNASLDSGLFGFDNEKNMQVQKLIKDEGVSLKALKQAIDENNTEIIIKRAVGIKPNFAKLFMQFGDFKN